jgi:integrase
MARESGFYRRRDSCYLWIKAVLPNGRSVCQSTRTEDRKEAEALLARLKADSFKEAAFGLKPKRSWQEAVVRYLEVKKSLRSARDVRRICRNLHPILGDKLLTEISGDVVWSITERLSSRGIAPATVNRYLATVRSILRMARDEWQWIDNFPKIKLLPGEVARDRWLTSEEAERLTAACSPHMAAIVRFALATGCRASEITGLEWDRVDLGRGTAWLNRTKNGTPRGVPLNRDAVAVLESVTGQHPRYCFTYKGAPIRWGVCNTAWLEAVKRAELADFRFHDLRHTWASWHRQAGTSTDELKDLGGWKSRVMVDRYAKFGTEHLAAAASRIESGRPRGNVVNLSSYVFATAEKRKKA